MSGINLRHNPRTSRWMNILFHTFNNAFLLLAMLITLYPVLNTVAISFNDGTDALRGGISIWPRVFSLESYRGVLADEFVFSAFQVSVARTLLRNKPYSPLLNTQFAKLPPTYMEEYFHRSALYCIFPSFFNGDVLEDGKWKTVHFFKDPALYERARPLYKQFIPVLRRMFAAGWDPVTYARALPAEVQVERYGPGAAREVLFAVFNPTQEPAQVKLTVPAAELKLDMAAKATALLAPADLPVLPDGDAIVVTVPVAAGRCEVVSLAP